MAASPSPKSKSRAGPSTSSKAKRSSRRLRGLPPSELDLSARKVKLVPRRSSTVPYLESQSCAREVLIPKAKLQYKSLRRILEPGWSDRAGALFDAVEEVMARAEEEVKAEFLRKGKSLNHTFYTSQGRDRDAQPHFDAALAALEAHGIAYDPRDPTSRSSMDTETDTALHLVKEANLAWDRVRNQQTTVDSFDRILETAAERWKLRGMKANSKMIREARDNHWRRLVAARRRAERCTWKVVCSAPVCGVRWLMRTFPERFPSGRVQGRVTDKERVC